MKSNSENNLPLIESERLLLRPMTQEDFNAVAEMLRNAEVMYAWEKTFTDEEICEWINRQRSRYQSDGTAYLLALEKASGRCVGQIGILKEDVNGEPVWGIGYILNQWAWHKGFAVEGAQACMDYAFTVLGADQLICEIRPQNLSSIRVAENLGMRETGEFIKRYNGKDMLHKIYAMKRTEYFK